jgi:uncharacterized protein
MRRVVFDSTVLVSAFLRPGGLSDELLILATRGDFGLVLAPEIIGETWRKLLTSDRIRKRYAYSDERVHRFCRGLLRICELVRGLPPIAAVARDPNDDMIIACAVKGQAESIITRDRDLLSLNSYQRIAIITPETFRWQLRQTG